MFSELWDAFLDWASNALNWLKNFFVKIWETIVSWWDALCDTIDEWLDELFDDGEVVVIDPSTQFGRDIYEAIKTQQPERVSRNKYKKQAMQFNSQGNLKKIADFEANNVRQKDDFEKDLEKKGVIRITK